MLFFLLELSISRIYRKQHEHVHQPWPKQSDLFRITSKKRHPFVISDHADPLLKPKDDVTAPFVPMRKTKIDKVLRPKTRPIQNRREFEACSEIDGQPYTCIKMPWIP